MMLFHRENTVRETWLNQPIPIPTFYTEQDKSFLTNSNDAAVLYIFTLLIRH
jgi:hypothetical protein